MGREDFVGTVVGGLYFWPVDSWVFMILVLIFFSKGMNKRLYIPAWANDQRAS